MLSDSSLLKSQWCRLAHYVLPVLTHCKVFCLIREGFVTLLPLLLQTTCSNNTQMGRCAGYLVVKRAKSTILRHYTKARSLTSFFFFVFFLNIKEVKYKKWRVAWFPAPLSFCDKLKVVKHGVISNVAT